MPSGVFSELTGETKQTLVSKIGQVEVWKQPSEIQHAFDAGTLDLVGISGLLENILHSLCKFEPMTADKQITSSAMCPAIVVLEPRGL